MQSYVDFFYLTHRPDPVPDPTREGVEREINVPLNEMLFIRDNLQVKIHLHPLTLPRLVEICCQLSITFIYFLTGCILAVLRVPFGTSSILCLSCLHVPSFWDANSSPVSAGGGKGKAARRDPRRL